MSAPTRRATERAMTERQLQDAVVECALRLGWYVYHPYDSRRSTPGFPDLTLAQPGRLVFVELKSASGRLRSEQVTWLGALHRTGRCEVYLFRPKDWLNGRIEDVLRGDTP